MRLEPTDHQLLRELFGWGSGNFPKGSLKLTSRELSERTGLHRNTVQRRLRALREGGVVNGFLYEPRPAHLGLVRAGHLFEGIDVVDGAHLQKLLAPFPFVSIGMLHAETAFLHTYHETEADVKRDIVQIRVALGASGVRASFISTRLPPHPGDALALSPLDVRLLLAMRRGFDRSVAAIARATGANRRSAARRIERFVEAEAGALLPIFRPGSIDGEVIAVYDVEAWDKDSYDSLAKAFPQRIMGPVGGGARPMVMVPVSNVGEAVRMRAQAAERPGLTTLRVYLMRDGIFPEACDSWLAAHVRSAPPPAVKR